MCVNEHCVEYIDKFVYFLVVAFTEGKGKYTGCPKKKLGLVFRG